jgi:hypothetical protein
VSLAEESPAVFDRFVTFIYHNRVDEATTYVEISFRIRTLVLADKFCTLDFQNTLIDAIILFHNGNLVMASDLAFIDHQVPLNLKLRKFLLDEMVYDLGHEEDHDQEYYSGKDLTEFLRRGGELCAEIFWAVHHFDRDDFEWPSRRDKCYYHTHESEKERETCEKAKKRLKRIPSGVYQHFKEQINRENTDTPAWTKYLRDFVLRPCAEHNTMINKVEKTLKRSLGRVCWLRTT